MSRTDLIHEAEDVPDGTSPWDHPTQAGFSNPANGILTLESDNSLTIIFQKTVNKFPENCQF